MTTRKRRPVRTDPGASEPPASPQGESHLDQLLDEALAATFPASDPVAPLEPERSEGPRERSPSNRATTPDR